MDERFLPAQRRYVAECAAMGLLAVVRLARLVLGVGGASTTQAISNFGRPMEAADMERLLSDELSVTKTPAATE